MFLIANNYGMNSSLNSTNDFIERTYDSPVIKTIILALIHRPSIYENYCV